MTDRAPHVGSQAKASSTHRESRVERSKQAVLAATVELLNEGGVSGLSVDEVARRSGVAKTTIYRHWPDRNALVLDACSEIADEQKTPDTGSLEGDLVAVLTNIAHLLRTANWSSVLPSIIDTAERDPAFAAVRRRIQNGHAAPLCEILTRAAGRGETLPESDHATIIATLLGPLFYRRWFSREPIDADFVKTIVARAIGLNAT